MGGGGTVPSQVGEPWAKTRFCLVRAAQRFRIQWTGRGTVTSVQCLNIHSPLEIFSAWAWSLHNIFFYFFDMKKCINVDFLARDSDGSLEYYIG